MLLRVNLILFFFVQFIFSQNFATKNYTTSEGLPNNAVRSIYLDKDAVLWVGTENGISRFENGLFYTIDQSNGLGHNSCWDISQDETGNMWFASYGGGLSTFDGTEFAVFTTKDGLPNNKTRKVFLFKDKIYVGTENGISVIDIHTHKLVTPKIPVQSGTFICLDFFEYQNEVYFASIFDGLYKVEFINDEPFIVEVLRDKNIYSTFLNNKNLYLSKEGYLQKYDVAGLLNKKEDPINFGTSIVWDYTMTNTNRLFAAADGVYNPDGGLYEIIGNQMVHVSEQFGIKSKVILNVLYDANRNVLYVGSNDKGLYEISLENNIRYNALNDLSCIDFESIDSTKYLLHSKGISILNSSNEIVRNVTPSSFKDFELSYIKSNPSLLRGNFRESKDYELNFNISANEIVFYEIVEHKKSLWIGTNLGVFELDEEGEIVHYIPKHSLKIEFAYDDKFIETVPYGGTNVYENVYQLKGKQFSQEFNSTPQFIVAIASTKKKSYLASVFNGLYVYQNGEFTSYLFEKIWNEKKFKHLALNDTGNLILAAEFGDVFIVDDTQKFKIIEKIDKDKILGKTINFIESYKDYLLIGTERGINIYKNGVIRLFDEEQGLLDCNVKCAKIFDSELWLGLEKGYFILDLDKVLANQKTVHSISISSILINNEPISDTKYKWFKLQDTKLICDYNQNTFSIDFIPSGHPYPHKLKFRYRIKSKNQWSPYSEKPNVYLSYLPYGNYKLEIEVFDSNSGQSTQFNVLQIRIKHPFWLQWWFLAIVFLFFIVVVFVSIKRYKVKANEKLLIEKRIAETKLDALASQMNPHFTFNAMNTVQNFIVSNDVDNSLMFIGELAKLMRLTLDNSSRKTISLEEEIHFLNTYIKLENVRFDNRVEVTIKLDDAVDSLLVKIPVMLLQPFVENVFVHAFTADSKNPQLNINFRLMQSNILECVIADNGRGIQSFKKMKLHKSKALSLVSDRLKLIQPEVQNAITTEFTEFEGTKITLLLKIDAY